MQPQPNFSTRKRFSECREKLFCLQNKREKGVEMKDPSLEVNVGQMVDEVYDRPLNANWKGECLAAPARRLRHGSQEWFPLGRRWRLDISSQRLKAVNDASHTAAY